MERLTVAEVRHLATELERATRILRAFRLGPADVALMEEASRALDTGEPRRALRILTDLLAELLREQEGGRA